MKAKRVVASILFVATALMAIGGFMWYSEVKDDPVVPISWPKQVINATPGDEFHLNLKVRHANMLGHVRFIIAQKWSSVPPDF